MSSVVLAHVDDLSGLAGSTECSLNDSLRLAHEGHDGAVGRLTGVHVEQLHAFHRFNVIRYLLDNAHVASLAEIGHALDDSFLLSHVLLRLLDVR